MGNLGPVQIDCGFQMLPALVQKINVRGKLDVRRSHRGVHDQLPVILLPALFLLLGGVGILPTFQRLLTAGWLIGIVTVIIVSFFVFCFGNSNFFRYAVVAVYVPAVLRSLAGAD